MSDPETTHGGRSAAAPKRRRWLRFSLRTLVLLVLLVGSGATLWWNWGPWTVACSFQINGKDAYPQYSDDDRYIVVNSWLGENGSRTNAVHVLNAETGAQQRAFAASAEGYFDYTRGDYLESLSMEDKHCRALYRLDTGERLDLDAAFPEYGVPLHTDCYTKYVVLGFKSRTVVAKLPSLQKLIERQESTDACISRDERRVAFYLKDKVEVYSTESKELLQTFKVSAAGTYGRFSPQGRLLSAGTFSSISVHVPAYDAAGNVVGHSHQHDDKWRTFICDTLTGTARYFDGFVQEFSPDGTRVLLKNIDVPLGKLTLYSVDSPEPIELPDLGPDKFSSDGALLLDGEKCRAYDVRTLKVEWEDPGYGCAFSEDGKFGVSWLASGAPGPTRILDGKTGKRMFEFSRRRWGSVLPDNFMLNFAHGRNDFVLYRSAEYKSTTPEMMTVWKMRRPAMWWGAAWLPEFWMTVALGAGLVWSVWRDRRIGKRA